MIARMEMDYKMDFWKPVSVTSCVTCYVISNYMSFCCIVDSANQMFLRVIAQPCALGLQDVKKT